MKYYKDLAGNVYAYNAIQTPEEGLVPMTETETEAHLAPKPPTVFEKIAEVQAPFLEQQTLAKSDFITARIEGDAEFEAEAQADYQASVDAMKQATSEVTGG